MRLYTVAPVLAVGMFGAGLALIAVAGLADGFGPGLLAGVLVAWSGLVFALWIEAAAGRLRWGTDDEGGTDAGHAADEPSDPADWWKSGDRGGD